VGPQGDQITWAFGSSVFRVSQASSLFIILMVSGDREPHARDIALSLSEVTMMREGRKHGLGGQLGSWEAFPPSGHACRSQASAA
jgi:hypothetical protein